MEIWCEYVFTIINSEKEMQEQRKHFGNYMKEIKDILKNEVISKKKSFTSVTKLINVIEKYMRITPSQLIRWKQNLSNLLLDNSVINTLFFQKPFLENSDQANVLKPSEQKLAIAQLLKTFCETKSKLVSLSLKIKANNVGKRMFQLLKSDKSYAHITRKEIVQILEEMEAVYE
jgi:DNA-binding TFAR19-related protein (PDSD5 family)